MLIFKIEERKKLFASTARKKKEQRGSKCSFKGTNVCVLESRSGATGSKGGMKSERSVK